MERSAQTPRIAVVEPARTRHAQMTMCASFVASAIAFRIAGASTEITVADLVCFPLAFVTIIHHLVVLIMAFRQRRAKYRPREIPHLVPTTARAGVVVSFWLVASLWVVVSMFYLMELRWRPQKTFIITSIEAALAFGIAVMCSRERLETLERLEEEGTQSIVFMVGEDGEYMVAQGP
ncbi:hypothetical protein CC1G_12110 [Coprinopsis cinerea okayama7|uniref:Uncharacterized protein n=1 Tax=Coprinopsis cinerea (strain Okayama-7 / 130 / ATCC MYA-4618 / FGSC 9003) TaxID=240176 RepID=A8PHB1_COPC7|nr:hypothetical protein CC1G_12110 [Coprinopsis cinerea okayama7\|eukprot:XP_001841375.2 hypothetical protein CC1G_12110 [Coprinopsis cinerea okayama7\